MYVWMFAGVLEVMLNKNIDEENWFLEGLDLV